MSYISLYFKDRLLNLHPLHQDDEIIIGQAEDCNLCIDSLAISPQHAKITCSDHVYSIEAMSGDAKLLINDNEVSGITPLSDGDIIIVGKHNLHFNFDEPNEMTTTQEPMTLIPEQLTGWLQYINGSEMGKTKKIGKKMRNISDEKEENIALISKRGNDFYISYLKGDKPPIVNNISIGEKSFKLDNNCEISIGNQKIVFFME